MVFRASPAAPRGLALLLGLASGLACNLTAHVAIDTYGDEAAEDYGCIVGDLGCECLAGDVCDGGLTCVDDLCRCVEGPCKDMPPVTTNDTSSDTGSDSGTGTGTDSTSTSDTGSTSDTSTDTGSSTDTSTDSSTDSSSGSDSSGSDSSTT